MPHGSGTTAGSKRLIHGSFGYVEMFDFAFVRSDIREPETILSVAPHPFNPLAFLQRMCHTGACGSRLG
jgi:glycerol-3-phosphate dehydrogenase